MQSLTPNSLYSKLKTSDPQTCVAIPITHACLNPFATNKILLCSPTKHAHSRSLNQAPLINSSSPIAIASIKLSQIGFTLKIRTTNLSVSS